MKAVVIVTCLILAIGVATAMLAEQKSPSASIHGRVTDLLGFPIQDALVEVTSEDKPQPLRASTDEQGYYKIINLPLGRLKVFARAKDSERAEAAMYLQAGESKLLDFGLEPGRIVDLPEIKIVGTVQQLDGTRLSEVTVTVTSAFNQSLIRRVRTDAAGRYEVGVYAPGQY